MTDPHVLTFDVGPDVIRYAMFSKGRLSIPTTIATPIESADQFYNQIASVAELYDDLDGISISMPGFIDATQRRAITSGSLPMLYKRNIGEELERALVTPVPVWVENDANCVAMAEKLNGNAKNLDDFVVITIDHGIGGAAFIDGKIRRGRNWRAYELGMMITNLEAGGLTNLHNYASTSALENMAAEKLDVPVETVIASGLFRRLDEPKVREVVEHWACFVAALVFNTIAMFDPQCVLLGGPICNEVALLPLIRSQLEKHPNWEDFHTDIKRCRQASNACLMGAYYAFLTEIEEQ